MMNLSDQLMFFRKAYLKSIALTWKEESIKEELISSQGVCKNVLINERFKQLLVKNGGLNWVVDVAIVENEQVSYTPENLSSNNGWNGSADVLVIKIPQNPYKGKRNRLEEAVALSSFYDAFTTLFGNGSFVSSNQSKMKSVKEVQDLFTEYAYESEQLLEALEDNLNYDLGVGGANSFLSFGASMLDLIASCWDDENYFNSILSTVLEPLGEANSTICSGLNIDFTNPWGFRIVFEKDTSCSWNEEKSKWEGLSNNEMYLQYPCKPEEELSGAQALARYNSTGPAFPLTCF